jgi:hypothetical protein
MGVIMSAIADLLIDIVDQIQILLQKEIDDETAANIQDWIMEHFDSYKDSFLAEDIAKKFIETNVCSKCKTIIYDHDCNCD